MTFMLRNREKLNVSKLSDDELANIIRTRPANSEASHAAFNEILRRNRELKDKVRKLQDKRANQPM